MPRPHRDLRVWKDAMTLVTQMYQLMAEFSDAERFGLTAQIRRAAVSVPSNVAEGAARGSKKEFVRSLAIARRSLSELDTRLRIAENLNYPGKIALLLSAIERLQAALGALIKSRKVRGA